MNEHEAIIEAQAQEAYRYRDAAVAEAAALDSLPDCEGWTCQSCGADNFIPPGFARVIPPERFLDAMADDAAASSHPTGNQP